MLLDTNTEFGARVDRRLREEKVIWFTAVRPDGVPQPNPVWFLWQDGTFLIYSQPNSRRLEYIARDALVALNMNSTPDGDDVVIFTGEARVDPSTRPADQVDAYIEKYREDIQSLNMTPATFARDYSVAIRVTPHYLRGY
jgi:PPOX class probable F420-dependent enzyme